MVVARRLLPLWAAATAGLLAAVGWQFVSHGAELRAYALYGLLALLLPHDRTLRPLRRGVRFLTQFAVDYRYPGENATKRQAAATLRWMERVRQELRSRLGLKP